MTCSTQDKVEELQARGVKELDLLYIDGVNVSRCLRNTLAMRTRPPT